MPTSSPTHAEMLKMIGNVYQDKMPFNRLLGIDVEITEEASFRVSIERRNELIGNFFKNILHGGVISAILDLTGGLIASAEVLRQMKGAPLEAITERLTRMGTIDLRVDYLQGGYGHRFIAEGTLLKIGKYVAVVRTELRNDEDDLIAAGTSTYFVGKKSP